MIQTENRSKLLHYVNMITTFTGRQLLQLGSDYNCTLKKAGLCIFA